MKNALFGWGLGAAAAALVGAGLFVFSDGAPVGEAGAASVTPAGPNHRQIVASFTSADQVAIAAREARHASIQRNETLSGLLDRIGAPRAEANGAVHAAGELVDLRRVRPGDGVTAWMETDAASGEVRLMGLSMRPDVERQVLVSRSTTTGQWVTHELRTQMTPGHNFVSGTVEQSIYQAALALGAGDQQVVDFASILGYDIDLQREVYPGDGFEILYETFDDERGQPVKSGSVLYAAMNGSALKKSFYRYTPSDDGAVDYFDEKGQSAKRFLMKTPINGARLSSSFGNRRHPILGYTRLHKGTDFAAPTGTPIYAAGSGVIERASRNGGYGNYVLIRHANGYKTAYAHLSRYGSGIKAGTRVRQGQVIGYVGTTGQSTGPHLHYEVYVNGKPVNAMTLRLPTGRTLEGAELEAFQTERARIDAIRVAEEAEAAAPQLVAERPAIAGPIPVGASSAPDQRPDVDTP